MSTLNRIPIFYLLVSVLLVLFHGKIGCSQNLPSPFADASEFEKKTVRFVSSDANHASGANSECLPVDLRQSIRDVYVWAWPMIYMTNVQKSLQLVQSPGVSGGAPVAPINNLCMLTEVVGAEFTSVPCPNRDVVYGFGLMDLAISPVISFFIYAFMPRQSPLSRATGIRPRPSKSRIVESPTRPILRVPRAKLAREMQLF